MASLWRFALQQFLGKFGERPLRSVYSLAAPIGGVTGWRLVSWRANVWAQDDHYYPSLYHPAAAAWIRQIAQIPLLKPIAEEDILRVYVDSVAVRGKTSCVESSAMGGWRKVASGTHWQANSAGNCRLSDDRGNVVWSAGMRQVRGFSLEERKRQDADFFA